MKLPRIRTVILFAVAFVAIVVGAYVINFAVIHQSQFSTETSDWGQFGDYIGGILNPLFAFLAFAGVLYTVHLQSAELRLARRQSELDELQRLISSISKEADSILNQKPSELGNPPIKNERFTIFQMLSALGTATLDNHPNAEALRGKAVETISIEINIFLIELHQLVWALDAYKSAGGSDNVIDFYKNRYEVLICWISASRLLGDNLRIREYFDPDRLAPYLRKKDQ